MVTLFGMAKVDAACVGWIFENPENSNRENFMKKKNSKINYMITKSAYNKKNIIVMLSVNVYKICKDFVKKL